MTGFTGTVILRGVGRGKQLFDTPERVEVARTVAGKFAAVVGFDDQRCADGAIESLQGVAHGGSGRVFQGHALDDVAAGEVTDIEEVAIEAIDGTGDLPDIGGPDGAGSGPGAGDHGAVVELLPEVATEARGDVGAIAECHLGEVGTQGADADAGAEERQMMAQLSRPGGAAEQGRSSQGRCWPTLGDALIMIALPGAQTCAIHIQRGGDVGGGIAGRSAAMHGCECPSPQCGFQSALGPLGRSPACVLTTGVAILIQRSSDGAHTIEMATVGAVIATFSGAFPGVGGRR